MTNNAIEFFLYTKSDCSSCDKFKSSLNEEGIFCRQINIENDPDLKQRYGARISVLVANGIEVCEGTYKKQAILIHIAKYKSE